MAAERNPDGESLGRQSAPGLGWGGMPDWTDQVADSIENAVVAVRDKTVVPAERLVAFVIAGLFLLFLFGAVGILLAAGAFRLVDVWVPSSSWATWLVFGGVFIVFGVLLLSLRK
jgi:hypothetical protein